MLALVGGLALVACGGETAGTGSGASVSNESAAAPCGVISSEELSEWTGRSTSVSDPEVEAGTTKCGEEVDGIGTIAVRWAFTEAEAPVPDLAQDAADILDNGTTQPVDLAEGLPGAVVQGELVGELPTVEVVTVLEGESLIVTVTELSEDPDTDLLREIALKVAEKYASGAGSADAPAERAPDALPPCDVITDADLSRWAGTPHVVQGPTEMGAAQECSTVREDPDDGLVPTWTVEEAVDSYAESVDRAFYGEAGREISLAGGVRASLMQSTTAGIPIAEVVTVIDGQLIEVEVADFSMGGEPVPVKRLRSVAVRIAGAYGQSSR